MSRTPATKVSSDSDLLRTASMSKTMTQSILVVGGGMTGMTAAIEAAEAGYDTFLVERNPYLGGRVAQLHQYFPKLCPPHCGLEINFQRIKKNPRLRVHTMATVERISGKAGNYDVTLGIEPRYVNERCTACGKCAEACELEIDSAYNYGMNKVRAAHLPHDFAYPMRYVLDPALLKKKKQAKRVADACPSGAIDLSMKKETVELKVGAIVWATGWPTQGKILRPSDGEPPKTLAFLQCAGSRDQNHLPFCSGICCLASLKQAGYVRAQLPDCRIYVFYIDIRASDRLEEVYAKAKQDPNIEFFKGKVAKITARENGLLLRVENTSTLALEEIEVDMAVLATGMRPNTAQTPVPLKKASYDEYGFASDMVLRTGVFAAGCTRTPSNVSEAVQDGTAAAMLAMQALARR
jgi:quinone-modifying oxidoreductase subunit QmoA